jgi:hypothetical protein
VNPKTGFTTVVAVDFGPAGFVYALELSDGTGFPAIGLSKVALVSYSGEIEEVMY